MSTDRELLELAAKAAGLRIFGGFSLGERPGVDVLDDSRSCGCRWWSPLTDDGDALRLAVKLGLSVSVFDDAVGIGSKKRPAWNKYEEFPIEGEPCAVTRRAIVCVAAEIGRGM